MKTGLMLCAAVACAITLPAAAQTTSLRTFVSGLGNDTGTCARSAPCRSFAYAINQTPAGGEIVAVDPAGYGSVTITKAISIIGPGPGLAQITVPSGGTGIAIYAGAGDAVVLAGIEVDGGNNGIMVATAGSVSIADSVVGGAGNGIVQSGAGSMLVARTTITGGTIGVTLNSGNMTLLETGISASSENGVLVTAATAQITNCSISGNYNGVNQRNGTVFVRRTTIANSKNVGFGQSFSSSAVSYFDHTTLNNNPIAVTVQGTIYSYGNNNIVGAVDGTLTTKAPN